MVWVLRAVEASIVPSTYYFKSAAVFPVGRKDCYITIQSDRAISRLHANLITEAAPRPDSEVETVSDVPRMLLRVKDLSKFGTFVKKESDAKAIALAGQETELREGDVVTFGTNKTSFRVEFVPFFFCVSSLSGSIATQGKENPIVALASLNGAYAVEKWKEGCTHVVVEESSLVTEMVLAAVASSKPVVQTDWWQTFSAKTSPITELPSCFSFAPTLKYQGRESVLSLKIAMPESRKSLLQGYTFFVGPSHLYENGEYLVRLLEVAGGCVGSISKKSTSNQAVLEQQLVVKPRDGTISQAWMTKEFMMAVANLPCTSEEKLVIAVLTGNVDVTALPLPASPVASVSSDETMEEDGNGEEEDSANMHSSKVPDAPDVRYEPQKQALPHTAHTTALEATRQPIDVSIHVTNVPADAETVNRDSGKLTRQQDRVSTATSSQQDGRQFVASGRKICLPTESPHESSPKPSSESHAEDICPVVQTDIIFSRLIVVKDKMDQFPWIQTQGSLPNFKRFRKGRAESGNTYSSLVPFAKEPYREADFGREVEEFMREEQKRKDAENLADDLFNAERLKRQMAAKPKPRQQGKTLA